MVLLPLTCTGHSTVALTNTLRGAMLPVRACDKSLLCSNRCIVYSQDSRDDMA